jgi:transglutaminase-like putative cysteine protease
MLIRYGCELSLSVAQPTACYVLVDIHPDRRADILHEDGFETLPRLPLDTKRDAFGNIVQRLMLPAGETKLMLSGVVRDRGQPDDRDCDAPILSVVDLPPDVAMYLNGSRYCETDKLADLAWNEFAKLPRTTRMVEAICDFVHDSLAFDYKRACSTRTALQAYEEGTGVCRDFTHLAMTLCRCMNIPARYVNGYLGDIGVPPDPAPMDFNAWFEACLGGRWYVFDARHNSRRIGRIPIARGRDACDVPMIQTFGPHVLKTFRVVTELVEGLPVAA